MSPRARVCVYGSRPDDGWYFPTRPKRDTLLFIDNIFRFTQAGSEVSAAGPYARAVGYQPTLATEMGQLQERITSTTRGAITSVQAVRAGRRPDRPGPGQCLPLT